METAFALQAPVFGILSSLTPLTCSSSCFTGYTGPQCEYLSCPVGTAWWDFATATDTAHAPATCSNMGLCASATGVCTCRAGFSGAACEFMSCPACQSGRCISMRDAAQANDAINFFVATTYSLWDADKIFGCQCGAGYTGYDCSQRTCPVGDDPMTTGQLAEVQMLNCLCNGCTGYFALYYKGSLSANIQPSATPADLAAALNALPSINGVTVTSSAATICPTAGATSSITFTNNGGNLPQIQIRSVLTGAVGSYAISLSAKGAAGLYGSVGNSATGTTEARLRPRLACRAPGVVTATPPQACVHVCRVFQAATVGAQLLAWLMHARRRRRWNFERLRLRLNDDMPQYAIFGRAVGGNVCNNQGTCNAGTSYRCVCNPPYTGVYCTQLMCPSGAAWFDGASATDTAHAVATCSNRVSAAVIVRSHSTQGICNPGTGTCTCQAGFTGVACEQLACAGSPTCSGQGTCKTMQQLAAVATANGVLIGATYGATPNYAPTWDFNKIQGCYCQQHYYMGPYVGGINDFQAYDCSARACPYGDDPLQSGNVDEQQRITCTADGGAFTVTFRQLTTVAIPASASAAVVQAALQSLATIVSATVTFLNGATTVCSAAGVGALPVVLSALTSVVTNVRFTYAQGALPLMTTSSSALTLTSGTLALTVARTVTGTKANLECSGRGTCDRTTGRCNCYDYFLSSDGNGNPGTRGDCGYRAPWSTVSQPKR
uniref:Secreted protein n=1 Tax=Achlya hypogyna TaxID=1202772 RepID=A0A0A7CPE3_ACHHY|nr:secreted protein [Achlya hypogyna]